MKVNARFEHQLLAVETEHRVHCMLELTAPAAPAGRVRPPLHLALVLDRSGSMAGPKLEVVRECASFLVRRLAPTDELALVTYDADVDLVAPLAPVHQDHLLARISTIGSGGQTNMSGGWLKGVEERPTEEVRVLGVLNAFPAVAVPGGLQLQLGDAFAEESRRVVFELHVPSLPLLGVRTIADVVLRYTEVGEQIAQHELTIPLVVNLVSADEAAAAGADAEVTEEVVILRSARAQQEARELADRGEFDQARKVLSEAAEDLRAIAPRSRKADELLEQAEMLDTSASMAAPESYSAAARKRMRYEERTRSERRRKRPNDPGAA